MADLFKKKPEKDEEQGFSPPSDEGGVTPSAPPPEPEKKSRFGRGSKKPKPPKEKKEKKKKEKKERAPKKAKPPREKKKKKPLFSFGKKKKTEEAPATGVPPVSEPLPGELPGAPGTEPEKKHRGKKGKAPKPPRQKKKKTGAGKSSPVGLDIGRTSITAVQLKYQVGGSTLLSAAVDNLPEGLIQEGEVKDVDALAFAIREFWKANKIRGRKVELGLANQKVVVRTLQFPVLEEKELRSAIEFQAQDYIPIPIEEAVFDFHVQGQFTDEDGIAKQKVLVVAAQKDMVMDFINAIKKAKLSVSGIDLQAFAMLRALTPKSFLDQEAAGTAVAVANIASDITNLVVSMADEPQFTRIISFGGDNFTRAVQDFRGLTFAEAEALKAEVGLPAPGEREEEKGGVETEAAAAGEPYTEQPQAGRMEESPFEGQPLEEMGDTQRIEPEGTEPGPETAGPSATAEPKGEAPSQQQPQEGGADKEYSPAEVQRILELTADGLADELRRSLDYYISQESTAPITKLFLSGGGAMLHNLDKHLSQIFPFEVVVGDPLQRVTQNRTDLTDEELKILGPRLAISIGLALEDED